MDTQEELVKIIEVNSRQRPRPQRKYDQFFATPETVVKRALYMQSQGDLDARVVFLGDDDLTSIAAGVLCQGKNPVAVVEIDPEINKLIKRIAQKESLKVEVTEQDLIEEFPPKLAGQFDIVFTDPPYTPVGVSLFLNRAIEAIRRAHTSRIYMCYGSGERATDREVAIQDIITEKGLLIREKIRNFNEYQRAATIGNTSSLFVLDRTPKTKTTPVRGTRIYTNQ